MDFELALTLLVSDISCLLGMECSSRHYLSSKGRF